MASVFIFSKYEFFFVHALEVERLHLVQLSLLVAVETPSDYHVKGKLKKKFLKLSCLV